MPLARDCKGNLQLAVLAALTVIRAAVLAPPAGLLIVLAVTAWRLAG